MYELATVKAMEDSTQSLIELEDRFGARNYKPLDVVLSRGEGIWVWDVQGRKYLDCLSAYSAVNQGHCHPKIKKTVIDQLERMTLTSRAFRNDQLALFYEDICKLTNSRRALPMNSGAEAVETAIKAVRKCGYQRKGLEEGKAEIIVCENNFHGRTLTIIGFSSEDQYREGFAPFTPGFKLVPFGDINALEAAITKNTVGFLVEPIQGEAGVIVPPDGYLKEARELCTKHNISMILDEIQTGLGRTGKMLAEEHEGIEADVTLLGKALSGGFYPISVVLANEELEVFRPGDHGSTFGGNPLACAIARSALQVLVEEKLPENAEKQGEYLIDELKKIDNPLVKEVRGKGLFVGIELLPEAGGARSPCERLMEGGILCKETHHNVIRLAPPLIIQKKDIDWMLERIVPLLSNLKPAT